MKSIPRIPVQDAKSSLKIHVANAELSVALVTGKRWRLVHLPINCFARENFKRAYENTKKNCKSFKLDKSNAVGVGNTAAKITYFFMPSGLSLVHKAL